MSFSSETKSELARLNLDKKCCRAVALATFLEAGGEFVEKRNKLLCFLPKMQLLPKIFKLSKELLGCKPVISIQEEELQKTMLCAHSCGPGSPEAVSWWFLLKITRCLNAAPGFSAFCLSRRRFCNPQRTYHLK